MFVELYIYEQYNPEMARRNTPKLKHFISIEKTKHLPKRNWQPWYREPNSWDQALFNEELFYPSHPGYDGLHAAKTNKG
jgi:hypothetical protein